jgi:SAM-dependent methyltransferase
MSGSEFWDSEVIERTHSSWMESLQVRHYINEQISGDPGMWPLEWFQRLLEGRTFDRALSIGCGTGELERSLMKLGLCRRIDAFDASVTSIAVAASAARDAGIDDAVRYFVSDFNKPALPRSAYDAVFFHQSLHHVAKLEKLLRSVLATLKPDGVVYLEEFIGPSRNHWTEETVAPYQPLYEHFTESMRFFDYMPFPVEFGDLSEAVRSADIVPQLRVGFEIDHLRGYGGSVLSVLFPAIVPEKITPEMVTWMLERDREATRAGRPHFYAVIVAHPKKKQIVATARYFVEPKIKWVLRKIRSIFVPASPPMYRKRTLLQPSREQQRGQDAGKMRQP